MALYFVYLRQPGGMDDPRDDPFWEFGSFGLTGCHRRNLLNPNGTPLEVGDRLAFLQGGLGSVRVVGLTPPIIVHPDNERCHVAWDPDYRPVGFDLAPVLVSNDGESAFGAIFEYVQEVARPSWCSKLASKFRARTSPIPDDLGQQVLCYFSRQGLPQENSYAKVVAPDGSQWSTHAIAHGWDTLAARTARFMELGGQPG